MEAHAQSSPLAAAVDRRSGDSVSSRRFQAIAAKVHADPELLSIPLNNIERWLKRGHDSRSRLERWKEMIEAAQHSPAGLEKLVGWLLDESPEARRWKGFSPFAGILSDDELDELSWSSRH